MGKQTAPVALAASSVAAPKKAFAAFDVAHAPTPEPSTWALLVIGFLSLAQLARRRTRAV
jgi:hypothetical protein